MRSLAVDAGQSHFSVSFNEHEARRYDDLRVEQPITSPHAPELLVYAIAKIANGSKNIDAVSIGLSGFVQDKACLNSLTYRIADLVGADRVVIGSDALTSYLGVLGTQSGAVAALGTGTIVLALGEDRKYAAVDGLGPILGDDGSGFAIGRAGLRAVFRYADGRGEWTDLVDHAQERFGALATLVKTLAESDGMTRTIASFARDVAESAAHGDQAALQILGRAGADVAESLIAARTRAGTPSQAPTILTGALTAAGDPFLTPIRMGLGLPIQTRDEASLIGAGRLLEAPAESLPAELFYSLERP